MAQFSGKKNIEWVIPFYLELVWNISHSNKISARRYHKSTQVVT